MMANVPRAATTSLGGWYFLQSLTVMGTPKIPNELYREIAEHLHHPDHRLTLVSLALVNSTWRHESQRMLFRIIDAQWLLSKDFLRNMHVRIHIHFLEVVLEHPTRLAPYVHSYEQKYAAVDPVLLDTIQEHEQKDVDGAHLWNLTCGALPFFVNLKRFTFIPIIATGGTTSLLHRFAPRRLTSLSIEGECGSHEQWGFMRSQRALVHLQANVGLRLLPLDACPALVSVVYLDQRDVDLFLTWLARRKTILALRIFLLDDWNGPLSSDLAGDAGLDHVRYLHLFQYNNSVIQLCRNIVLLVLIQWTPETIESLPDLDALRTLALDNCRMAPNITRSASNRAMVAREGKKRCPMLIYIVHILSSRGGRHRFTKITLSLRQSSRTKEDQLEIRKENVLEYNPDALWWQIYDV